ncbi:MAG: hypothetical protein SFV21_06200 [Rhodospirillaceae bacterium]|nr:hypothetical protein [Rhodospirillaceae bacterium]
MARVRRIVTVALLVLAAQPALAQDPPKPILLASEFGELCTMCEAAVRCEPAQMSETARATVYVFHKKSFMNQVATIWDYLPFVAKSDWESRPATIYQFNGDSVERGGETARLNFTAAKAEVGGTLINRLNGEWQAGDGSALGLCREIDRTQIASLGTRKE